MRLLAICVIIFFLEPPPPSPKGEQEFEKKDYLFSDLDSMRPAITAFAKASAVKYVFIIDIDKRKKRSQVSRLRNWECIGTADQVTVRCGPGHPSTSRRLTAQLLSEPVIKLGATIVYVQDDNLQACQLIVDEGDTYIESGKRILKPGVKIIASKAESFWYVSNYISPSDNLCMIHNETY